MHSPHSIKTNAPLFAALACSAALHLSVWHPPAAPRTEAIPRLETGRTVVRLQLRPASVAPAANPLAPAPKPVPIAIPILPIAIPRPPATDPAPTQLRQELVAPPPAPPRHIPPPEAAPTPPAALGATTDAAAVGSIRPVYPRISRRRGEQGQVDLRIEIHANGAVGQIEILHSSGHPRLDQAAIAAIRETSFLPAQRHGRAVASTLVLPIIFELTHE